MSNLMLTFLIDKIIEKLLYIFAGISYNERNCEL